jgi:hypothetical protein
MKKILVIILILISVSAVFADETDTLSVFQDKKKSPIVSIGLSTILPAGGQFYNEKWVKGSIFLGAEFALGGLAAFHYYSYSHALGIDLMGKSDPLTTAKQFTWFFAVIYVYSIMDAYVDAQLSDFPNERIILEPDPKINGVQLSFQF